MRRAVKEGKEAEEKRYSDQSSAREAEMERDRERYRARESENEAALAKARETKEEKLILAFEKIQAMTIEVNVGLELVPILTNTYKYHYRPALRKVQAWFIE